MFNSAQCATKKALPKSVQDSNDSCSKTEWPNSTHKLCCRHARKNWHVTRFSPPSVLLRWGDPCQWSYKQVQLQDLRQSKSTCRMWVGERQPQSEHVGRLKCISWMDRFSFWKRLWLDIRTWTRWSCMHYTNYHFKLSSNKMGCRHILLGITWTERWLRDGSAEVAQSLGPLGRQI
jgi:hypothetical protein